MPSIKPAAPAVFRLAQRPTRSGCMRSPPVAMRQTIESEHGSGLRDLAGICLLPAALMGLIALRSVGPARQVGRCFHHPEPTCCFPTHIRLGGLIPSGRPPVLTLAIRATSKDASRPSFWDFALPTIRTRTRHSIGRATGRCCLGLVPLSGLRPPPRCAPAAKTLPLSCHQPLPFRFRRPSAPGLSHLRPPFSVLMRLIPGRSDFPLQAHRSRHPV